MARTVSHGTFVIERTYPAAPERIFAAFSDATKKRKWFAGGDGPDTESHTLDFRVGGIERTVRRMGDGTPFPGAALINESVYQDIQPGKRIVFAYTMSLNEYRISASLATVELLAEGQGTKMVFTDQGAYFEGSDGVERREHGWKTILQSLDQELAA
ncbi:MAG TPA: SRPBCC family protein [Dongiaceae bacterium]|nr:SRPBCC family protein [Dongiaceae bacterium]